jgi:CxxC-x17-CxxC domain-containing protein
MSSDDTKKSKSDKKKTGSTTPVVARITRRTTRPATGPKRDETKRGVPPVAVHGTRVHFNLVCARCGADDTLPFVPKTLGEMLCRECARQVFGEDWAHGRPVRSAEEHRFTCAECGREDTVPFEPDGRRELLCRACMRGEEQPRKERLARMKKIE